MRWWELRYIAKYIHCKVLRSAGSVPVRSAMRFVVPCFVYCHSDAAFKQELVCSPER